MMSRQVGVVAILTGVVALMLLAGGSLATDQDHRQVPAEEVVERAVDGLPIRYDGVIISGDLDLRGLGPLALSSIEITNSQVQGVFYLENATVSGPVLLAETDFENWAVFRGTAFEDDVTLSHVGFKESADLSATSFFGEAVFDGSSFEGDVDFSESVFYRNCSFDFVQFSPEWETNFVYFGGTNFLGNASFKGSRFGKYLYFYGANFTREANFLFTSFEGHSLFGAVWFGGDAVFESVQFLGYTIFGDSHFEGDLLLTGSSISNMMLPGITFGEGSRVSLNNSDAARMVVPWDELEDHLVYRGEVYLALVENYKRLGWFHDADKCYYVYRRTDQANKDMGWSKALDYAAWVSCGYGVRPDYTFAWSIVIILIFGVVFFRGKGLLEYERQEEVGEKDQIRSRKDPLPGRINIEEGVELGPEGYALAEPHYPSLGEALYFSSLVFIAQAPADYLALGRYKYLVILEGILGWIMLALFLVSLGNIMIR